ncbi:MAG: enoyl-CoA hydratase/isomerase family protein [Chloroflexi bacterium]|nr:enoyl-CoA hydratase/isomerase family protein [Chloroflexota bacterium]
MSIRYQTDGYIATITLDNARRANAIDKFHALELADAWRNAWEDRAVRAIVVTGEGDRHFCGGHDLSLRDDVSDEEHHFLSLERIFRQPAGYINGMQSGIDGGMADHFPRIHKPVIAAVNGWAVGAGLYLLLASTDIRIAAIGQANFRFGLISRGWVGAGPGATLLLKQLRYVDAMNILLADTTVDAEEAVRIGLVNEAVSPDQLMARAFEIAHRIAEMPPLATIKMKEFVHRFADLPVEQAWNVQSLINSLLLHTTQDAQEGRDSFLERRDPNYTGEYSGLEGFYENASDEERARLEELKRQIDW